MLIFLFICLFTDFICWIAVFKKTGGDVHNIFKLIVVQIVIKGVVVLLHWLFAKMFHFL